MFFGCAYSWLHWHYSLYGSLGSTKCLVRALLLPSDEKYINTDEYIIYTMKVLIKKHVEDIQGFVLSVVGIAVVLAIGLIVLGQLSIQAGNTGVYSCSNASFSTVNGTLCTNGTVSPIAAELATFLAGNTTTSVVTQLGTIPNWIGILITVALAFIVLGYFYNRG